VGLRHVQRAEGGVHAFMASQCRAGVFLARLDLGQRLGVGGMGLLLRAQVAFLPLAHAPDRSQAQGQAGDDAGEVLAQPCADAFALFVLVQKVVDCHAVSCPAPYAAGLCSCSCWMGPRTACYCAGLTEPSEDTAKPATFARLKGDRSTILPAR